jgi:sugar/nucleoside kinase (ribokinase family)
LNPAQSERRGILAGGNWIVDRPKIIDVYPVQDSLANILRETSSNGGSPYNVLIDLARLQAPFPLFAVGLVGEDPAGEYILRDCRAHGIDTRQLRICKEAPTSYTDVMTVQSTGRRTFFHQRGANAFLGAADFDFAESSARIFHLGYLLLLDRLDQADPNGKQLVQGSVDLPQSEIVGAVGAGDVFAAERSWVSTNVLR